MVVSSSGFSAGGAGGSAGDEPPGGAWAAGEGAVPEAGGPDGGGDEGWSACNGHPAAHAMAKHAAANQLGVRLFDRERCLQALVQPMLSANGSPPSI